MKLKIPKQDKKLSPMMRIIYFIFGMFIASALIVYGVSWLNPPFDLTLAGMTLNQWFVAAGIVIAGLIAGSLIKSAILGKTRLD